jgi:hypothetical protein
VTAGLTYQCVSCESATFLHPAGEESSCGAIKGSCAILYRAGWRPAQVRVSLQAPEGHQDQHLLTRGGWVCPECVGRFAKPEEWLR